MNKIFAGMLGIITACLIAAAILMIFAKTQGVTISVKDSTGEVQWRGQVHEGDTLVIRVNGR